MKLRSYQEKLNIDILNEMDSGHKRILAVMPTGAGKGTTISALVKAFSESGKRCYILAHRNELIGDLSNRIEKLGIEHGVISPHYSPNLGLMIQVGSVQTVARRLDKLPTPDVIIQDEAHHLVIGNTWGKIIDHWPDACLIGKTATPIRLSGQGLGDGHGGYFTSMVVGPSAAWLTENGYLSPSKVYAPPIGFSADKVKKSRGDFDMKIAGEQLKAGEIMGDVVSHYKKYLNNKTAIAFCCSVEHAEEVAASFNAAKINSASIDGSMGTEQRAKLLSDLESGEIKVLTSCALIGEGIDIPNVSGCILLRPTTSISLHLQMIGRCLRPQDGKTAIILDHVGNILRLGHHMYFTEEDWSLEGKEIDKTQGDNALKTCPDCHSLIPRGSRECQECGHDFTIDPIEFKIVNGELVEFSPYEELRPIIEPMVEEGMSLYRISRALFELGHTSSKGTPIGDTVLKTILKKLGLITKNKKNTSRFSKERINELRPIIEHMVEEGMNFKQISKALFELDHTNNVISDDTVGKILKILNLKTKNERRPPCFYKEQLSELRPIIEPMIEEGASYKKISKALFELGYTNNTGNPICHTVLLRILKKLDFKTKNEHTTDLFSKEQLSELRPIIEPMIEEGKSTGGISRALFELGYTSSKGKPISRGAVRTILKKLDFKTKYDLNEHTTALFSKKQLSELRPIIEPMIEEGASYKKISKALFELGYTSSKGKPINYTVLKTTLKKLGLKNENLKSLQHT
jgi:DNA repair protein RadD